MVNKLPSTNLERFLDKLNLHFRVISAKYIAFSEEKKQPEHNYSVTFVTKVGTTKLLVPRQFVSCMEVIRTVSLLPQFN